jgi:predicted 3-demethylubiquinone-9 3-methyltransferase (glyoxalase superfamily)
MVSTSQNIIPFLWFDNRAEEAIRFYTDLFPNSSVDHLKKWGPGSNFPPEGIMMGTFHINGLKVHAFDAGPQFTFNESVSFFVECKDQQEIDKYWYALIADGGNESQCGWLKDRFGFSWQIVPKMLGERMSSGDPKKMGQMFQALMGMKKLSIEELEKAYEGN